MSKEQQRDDIEEAFINFAAEYPQSALALITGLFVGLLEHSIEQQDGDKYQEIVIEGGEGRRSITVHAMGAKP